MAVWWGVIKQAAAAAVWLIGTGASNRKGYFLLDGDVCISQGGHGAAVVFLSTYQQGNRPKPLETLATCFNTN